MLPSGFDCEQGQRMHWINYIRDKIHIKDKTHYTIMKCQKE